MGSFGKSGLQTVEKRQIPTNGAGLRDEIRITSKKSTKSIRTVFTIGTGACFQAEMAFPALGRLSNRPVGGTGRLAELIPLATKHVGAPFSLDLWPWKRLRSTCFANSWQFGNVLYISDQRFPPPVVSMEKEPERQFDPAWLLKGPAAAVPHQISIQRRR